MISKGDKATEFQRTLIDRVKIVCASGDSLAIQKRLEHDNYDVTRSGPIRISATRVDASQHLIVAEREIHITPALLALLPKPGDSQ